MTEWIPPGPGPWQQDSAHTPVSQSAILQESYPAGFNRGFTETFARYGLLLDRLAMGVVNGFTYHQPQPFDMPGPDGPMTPDEIDAEFGRRIGVAASAFETKLWRQDLEDWDNDWKPKALARHRELGGVVVADLDDSQLAAHLGAAAEHVSEMVYQHHRFNMAAMLPVGDFVLHASGWTGRPPHTLLGVLDGYSTISGSLPDEMRAAVDAIRADAAARHLIDDVDTDPQSRLDALRASVPAVDDYVRTIECRLVDGFDVVNPTLGEQPEIILGKLAKGLDAEPLAARRGAQDLSDTLRDEVPPESRDAYDELLGEARNNYRLRDERGIFSEITAIGILRRALLEVGRRATERGHLHQVDDILDATIEEARQSLRGNGVGADALRARANQRRALTAGGAPRHLGPPPPPPPAVDGLPPPLARLMSATGFMIDAILGQLDEAAGDDALIVGLGGNGGVREGIAHLVTDIDDLMSIDDGEIVVASATSEAFNCVLHLVSGIVTDHGSYACHAAIVAREMGIPAVVGTVNGTKRIHDGDRIEVDGSKGEVRILTRV